MPSLTLLNKPEPLLLQVLSVLTSGWKEGLLDLSETAVVLPTQESRRRLHEALVREAASRSSALLPPVWMLPMQLPESGSRDIAPTPVEQLCWISVLKGKTQEELSGLFAHRPMPEMDTTHSLELGNRIRSLRGELAQAGISLEQAVQQLATENGGFTDPRWSTLLHLESLYLKELTKSGLQDRILLQLAGIASPLAGGAPITRVIIAGVPDLPKAYESIIPKLEEQGIPVDLLVCDPDDRGSSWFDEYGRPGPRWAAEEIKTQGDHSRTHLYASEAEMAEATLARASSSGGSFLTTAVGVTSPEVADLLEETFRSANVAAFNPAGTTLDSMALGRLLGLILAHLQENDFRSALQLLRNRDIQTSISLDPEQLKRLDQLQSGLIPSSLEDLMDRWEARRLITSRSKDETEKTDHSLLASLITLQKLTALVARGKGPLPVLELLRGIYGSRNLKSIPGAVETAEKIAEWIQDVVMLADQLPSTEVLSLILQHLGSQICTGEKPPSSIELQGWLELLWEDAPHLVVTGMNDGLVPEVRPPDPFLTEKIRERWNLPSNKTRLHRDSYQAACLVAARSNLGRVDFLLSRRDAEGSFLKPSRLLLQCREEELAARVESLFRELPQRTSKPWRSAWQLEAQASLIRKPDHLSASSIREYLACPTRFYFKKLAGLSKETFGVEELEGNVFGSLLHETLQEFGSDSVARDLTDETAIIHDLEQRWTRIFHARYGEDPDLALLYQLKIGTKRLREAARVQAELRAEGWEIVGCEFEFHGFRPKALDPAKMPLPIVGRIDRIDRKRNEDGSHSWRIIDYKSSDKAEVPQASHLKKVTKTLDRSAHQEYEFVGLKKTGKSRKKGEEEVQTTLHRWIDLQLPIYALVAKAVREGALSIDRLPKIDGEVESAYFQMPADDSGTGIAIFSEFEGWEASALKCLSGVSRSIQGGLFWPPRDPKYDDFEGLFFDHLMEQSASLRTINPEPLVPLSARTQDMEERSGGRVGVQT